jgi:hypothetical protein
MDFIDGRHDAVVTDIGNAVGPVALGFPAPCGRVDLDGRTAQGGGDMHEPRIDADDHLGAVDQPESLHDREARQHARAGNTRGQRLGVAALRLTAPRQQHSQPSASSLRPSACQFSTAQRFFAPAVAWKQTA